MRKVLVLLNKYSSEIGQNANCLRRILKKIDQNCNKIYVLSFENKKCAEQSFFGETVINVFVDKEKSGFAEVLRKKRNIKKGLSKAKELIKGHEISTVIAVVNPIEAAVIGQKIKKHFRNVKLIVYEIDSLSNRFKTPNNLIEKAYSFFALKEEKIIYRYADLIINMKTHKSHYDKKQFGSYRNKMIFLDIPYLTIDDYSNEPIEKSGVLNFVYGGALYKNMRSIDYCLSTFKRIGGLIHYEMNVYTNSQDQIKDFQSMSSLFNFHSLIGERDFKNIVKEADFLISLGNKNSDFLPSKILGCISLGKPIIHFYSEANDVAVPYLQRYPLSLLLFEGDDFDVNVNKLINFIKNYKKISRPTRESLLNEYKLNTPDYAATVLNKEIE